MHSLSRFDHFNLLFLFELFYLIKIPKDFDLLFSIILYKNIIFTNTKIFIEIFGFIIYEQPHASSNQFSMEHQQF